MDAITKMLKQNKPDITDSSVKAYTANLRKLHDRLHGSRDFTDVKWLKDSDAVLNSLESTCGSYLTCRNYLNAVIVVLLNHPEFESVDSISTSLRAATRNSPMLVPTWRIAGASGSGNTAALDGADASTTSTGASAAAAAGGVQ